MAVLVREQVAEMGWQLTAVPVPGPPLETLADALCTRVCRLLVRHGFATVEEIAAAPDRALCDVQGMGSGSIERVHAVLVDTAAAAHPVVGPITLTEPQVCELRALLIRLADLARGNGSHDLVRRVDVFVAETVDRTIAARKAAE